MKKINYSKDAARALSRMQPKRADAILDKVEAYARGESVDIKKLKGSAFYRIRVGQDRVIIDDENNVVLVLKAGPRGDIYEP
jgi:mRNA interferase RelE/StbE